MTAARRFVLFELNEVPLRVVADHAARHPQSAFARILDSGVRFDTVTPDKGHLSPWITWPTLHRGVPSSKHGIVALGQDVGESDSDYPPVWTLLTNAGRRVGLFGSLHSYPLPDKLDRFDFYVPDTFASGPETKPSELSEFQKFNLRMVDRSGRNVPRSLPTKEALAFLLQSVPAGLRPATLAKVARQIASERIWKHRTARRRTLQSLLGFDLFLAQLRSKAPDAAFFFTNHVASSMHRYWPAAFKNDYSQTRWSNDWVRRYSGEIDYAMGEADLMLGELMRFADQQPAYVVLVSGSMGQAAVDDPRKQVSRQVLLRDMGMFLDRLGISGKWQRRRTMEPTYTLAFDAESDAEVFMAAIATTRIGGTAVEHRRIDSHTVEFVLGQYDVPDEDFTLTIGNRGLAPEDAGIANVPIIDEVASAAYHVPEGMLLVYDPRRKSEGARITESVSTTRIAPTLLVMTGVTPPAYMDRPLEQLVERELELA